MAGPQRPERPERPQRPQPGRTPRASASRTERATPAPRTPRADRTPGNRADRSTASRTPRPERAARPGTIPVAMPDETRAAAWLRNFRLSGLALSTLFLLVASLVVLAPSLKTLVEQRQQIAQLERERDAASGEVDDLQGEIDRWSDPAYIEAQARDRLYYVHPGDIAFLVIGEESLDGDAAPPISDEIEATQIDWVRALLSTVVEAGLTDATPDELAGEGG